MDQEKENGYSLLTTLLSGALSSIINGFWITLAVLALMAMAGFIDLSFTLWALVVGLEAIIGASAAVLVYFSAERGSNESSV